MFGIVLCCLVCVNAELFGLELLENSPAHSGLVGVDERTGNVTKIGEPLQAGCAAGDLRAIDKKRQIYYFLGDTSSGTTLVAVNLTNGAQVCSKSVTQLKEVGMVGFGQSLDYDYINEELVLTGLSSKNLTAGHLILRMGTALNACDEFKQVGFFSDGDYLPMLHSSSLDIEGQRLFVLLAPAKNEVAIGVIDLKKGVMTKNVVEGQDPDDFVGIQWNPKTKSLVGIMPDQKGGLQVRSLDPLTGKWMIKAVEQGTVDKPFGSHR